MLVPMNGNDIEALMGYRISQSHLQAKVPPHVLSQTNTVVSFLSDFFSSIGIVSNEKEYSL